MLGIVYRAIATRLILQSVVELKKSVVDWGLCAFSCRQAIESEIIDHTLSNGLVIFMSEQLDRVSPGW